MNAIDVRHQLLVIDRSKCHQLSNDHNLIPFSNVHDFIMEFQIFNLINPIKSNT
jgi:hypothetical protein